MKKKNKLFQTSGPKENGLGSQYAGGGAEGQLVLRRQRGLKTGRWGGLVRH